MLLELVGCHSYYGRTPILHNLNLSVPDGGCIAVLGRNGVGKTTLLRTIMGLTSRMTGTLKINGVDAGDLPTHQRSLIGLGYVPQGRGILPKFTVKENIVLGTFARQDGKEAIPDICLELFPYLADNLQKRAGSLSGGQQQQLAIARALATDPKILLLDEPTEGIQPNIVSEIERTLLRLKTEMGKALVLTEQHIRVAKEICDLFVIMDHGYIVESGPISKLTNEVVDKYLAL